MIKKYQNMNVVPLILFNFYISSAGIALTIIWLIVQRYCGQSFAALHTDGPRYIQGGALARDAGFRMTELERRKAMEAALIQRRVTYIEIEEKQVNGSEIDPCSICLADYKEGDVKISSTHCDHIFHYSCLLEWLIEHDDCPNCRSSVLTPSELKEAVYSVFTEAEVREMKSRAFYLEDISYDIEIPEATGRVIRFSHSSFGSRFNPNENQPRRNDRHAIVHSSFRSGF